MLTDVTMEFISSKMPIEITDAKETPQQNVYLCSQSCSPDGPAPSSSSTLAGTVYAHRTEDSL